MGDVMRWWHGLGPEVRALIRDGGIVVAGSAVGWIAGRLVKAALSGKGVERYLRPPWSEAKAPVAVMDARGRPQGTTGGLAAVAGWLVTLTAWAGAVCWIAWLRHAGNVSAGIGEVLLRGWEAAGVILFAVLAGGWLARVAYDVFQTPWLKRELDGVFPGTGGAEGSFAETAARAVCVVIYVAFLLFVPVALGGIFKLASLSGLVGPAWQLCARLLTAALVFAVGYVGLGWVRSQSKANPQAGERHPDLEYYAGLGISVAATLLALGLLVGTASGLGLIVVLAVLGFLLWTLRHQVLDLWAGLMLRMQHPRTVTIGGVTAEVGAIGPLMTTLVFGGRQETRSNSEVLEALRGGAKSKVK